MAQIPANILKIIYIFLELVEVCGIHIKEAILYGSYANGTKNEWSDIDLAIVSDDFT